MEYKLKVYTIWEMGQRENQEDSIFPAHGEESEGDRMFIVCDGMGGHEAGEVASKTVCEAMSNYVIKRYKDEGDFSEEDMKAAVNAAFDALDDLEDGDEPKSKKMGTTLACLKLHSNGYMIAHLGDSRVYHIRPDEDGKKAEIVFVTRDHSLVNDLITIGELTPEEAEHSNQKNVITRAMQPRMERRPQLDIYNSSDIKAGDYFYLCSDGMLENMNDNNICYQFSGMMEGGPDRKVLNLVESTKDNQDNHSAIIVHILEVNNPSKKDEDECVDSKIEEVSTEPKEVDGNFMDVIIRYFKKRLK